MATKIYFYKVPSPTKLFQQAYVQNTTFIKDSEKSHKSHFEIQRASSIPFTKF